MRQSFGLNIEITLALVLVATLIEAFACPRQYHLHKGQTFGPKTNHRTRHWMI